jgi:hypothetical protein
MKRRYCSWPGCERRAGGGTLCSLHEKRRQRGTNMNAAVPQKIPPFELVIEVGSRYLESETDAEERANKAKLRRAAAGWLRAEGWMPPDELRRLIEEEREDLRRQMRAAARAMPRGRSSARREAACCCR